jgi:TatD DNase family protein
MYIDSHCHLNLSHFQADASVAVARARKAGVAKMLVVGTELADSLRAVELAHQLPGTVFATVGIHPHESKDADENVYARLRALAADDKVVAYGEIGLDYHHNHSPREIQRREFARQLNLATELKLPVVIHDREAHQDVYDIIVAEEGYRHGGVIHCFSADYSWARRFIELGFVISLPGTITFPRSETQREVARRLKLDDILIETDAPFLAPVPRRGKRNEPAYVVYVAAKIAEIRGVSPGEVAAATTANCKRVLGI